MLTGKDDTNFLPEKVLPRFKKWSGSKKYGLISEDDKKAKKTMLPFSLRRMNFMALKNLSNLIENFTMKLEILK